MLDERRKTIDDRKVLDERRKTKDDRKVLGERRKTIDVRLSSWSRKAIGSSAGHFSFFILSFFILSACTDYSQQFEDDYAYGRSGGESVINGYSLLDKRDNISYAVRKVGNLLWMMDDLAHEYYSDENYKSTYCYQDRSRECDKTGRLYPGEHLDYACPQGWRLPTKEEWKSFYSTSVFRNYSTERTNLFKGYVSGDHSLNELDYKAYYWTSGEPLADGYNPCVSFDTHFGSLSTGELCHEQWKLSVRCVTEAGNFVQTDEYSKYEKYATKQANIEVKIKPTAYQNQVNCNDTKGWKNCGDFFILVQNKENEDFENLQLRFYLGAGEDLETPVSYITQSFDSSGLVLYPPSMVTFEKQKSDASGIYYLPIGINKLSAGQRFIFQVKWLNDTFASFRNGWSIIAHTGADAPVQFDGIDLTVAPYYTKSETYGAFEELCSLLGYCDEKFTLDPYIPVYSDGWHISGYGPKTFYSKRY